MRLYTSLLLCFLALCLTTALACGETEALVEGSGEQIECRAGSEPDDDNDDAIIEVGALSADVRCYVLSGSIGDDDDEEDTYRLTLPPDVESEVGFSLMLENEDAEAKLEFEDNDDLNLTTDCDDDDPSFTCARSFDEGEFEVTVNAEDEEGGYTLQIVLQTQ
jgi:hypothetical protein